MMRRSHMRAVGVVAGLCLLAAFSCGKKSGSRSTSVHLWQFWDIAVVAPIIAEFEKQNPGLHVEVEQLTWATGLEKIQAALASGTQPDVCELGSTWLPRFSYEGVLEDLTAVYEAERDSFLMWDSALYKGSQAPRRGRAGERRPQPEFRLSVPASRTRPTVPMNALTPSRPIFASDRRFT